MATNKTSIVFNGYLSLNSKEQDAFIDLVNDYNQRVRKGLIKEGSGRLDGEISLGPLQRSCPCCGRS